MNKEPIRGQSKLLSTQRLLWRLIVAPEGVHKALQHTKGRRLPILGDARLSGADRLDIYANMYFFRIRDSLKEDFPSILFLLGEDGFHRLVTDYLIRYPSTHWSLRDVGRHMASFLSRYKKLQHHPHLKDLARFEWALMEAFDAADAKTLKEESLVHLRAAAWPKLNLKTIPAFQILSFDWEVDQLRETCLRHRKPLTPRRGKIWIRVWRRDLKVLYLRADSLEARLLQEIQKGIRFDALCEKAAQEVGPDKSIQYLTHSLKGWLREGILLGLTQK